MVPFAPGLQPIADGTYAYLQPSGGWGFSNAGLVTSRGQSLLVDTLYDLPRTQRMLDAMRRAVPAAVTIDVLVNTHANGDHCWGNQLVEKAEIIASRRGALEMDELPPSRMALLMRAARAATAMGPSFRRVSRLLGRLGFERAGAFADLAPYVLDVFGAFDFRGIRLVPPTRVFDGSLELCVGDKRVQLIEVGPAHTEGDVIVHSPADRTVFAGDILFIGGHPIVWAGPVANWVAACDRILEMDVDFVVPGHGPITDKAGVTRVKQYLEYVQREARARFDAGMPAGKAALDIALDGFSGWLDAERIAVNVDTLYREFSGDTSPRDPLLLLARMARLARRGGSARRAF